MAADAGAAGGIETEDPYVASVAVAEALQDLDRRRLAGAVGAEQAEHLAASDIEADVAHGGKVAVGLLQVVDLDGQTVAFTPGIAHAEQGRSRGPRREVPGGRNRP
jgi:hypothetical protein